MVQVMVLVVTAVVEVERCDLGVVIQVTQVVAVMQAMQIIGQMAIQAMQVVQVTTGPEGAAAAAAAAAEALTALPDPLQLQEEPAQVLHQQHPLQHRGAPTWIVH